MYNNNEPKCTRECKHRCTHAYYSDLQNNSSETQNSTASVGSSISNNCSSYDKPPKLYFPSTKLKIAVIQSAPVFMNKIKTVDKMLCLMEEAKQNGAEVCVFPETYLPGYAWWTVLESATNMFYEKQDLAQAIYLKNAVTMDDPEVQMIVNKAKELNLFTIFGCAELTSSKGSVYCTMVFIDPREGIVNVHRKLIPTFMERLSWAYGDGHGLKVMDYKGAFIGGLNCWEDWMPLARFTLYAQGEQVHFSIWPGIDFLTTDIPKFIAKEGRVYSIACCGVLDLKDVPDDYPLKEEMRIHANGKMLLNGGSCAYGPTGETIIDPVFDVETILYFDIDTTKVQEARRVFDPAGHYDRPDVFDLRVNTARLEPIHKIHCE